LRKTKIIYIKAFSIEKFKQNNKKLEKAFIIKTNEENNKPRNKGIEGIRITVYTLNRNT
jgi:hypothetical protein